MTGSFNDYLEEAVLNHVFGLVAFDVPASLYIGVCTGGVTEAGVITGEPSGDGYERVEVTNDDSVWYLEAGAIKNLAAIIFPEAEDDWGIITSAFIADNATPGLGEILAAGTLTISKAVNMGDVFSLPADDLVISLD